MTRLAACLTIGLLILFTGCAPTRYPPGYHEKASSAPTFGSGGHEKRGNPYVIYGKRYYPLASAEGYNETGIGSWYGKKFHGKKTANGETYNMYAMSAAHTTLPLPSTVLVTNLENGKSVQVRVNDRGPFVKDRLIDLSYSAAQALGYTEQGTARVRVEIVGQPVTPKQKNSLSHKQAAVSVLPAKAIKETNAGKNIFKQAYVQVGAFSEQKRADGVVSVLQPNLKENHPPLKVIMIANIYRVRLGPFDLDKDALTALQHVRNNGYDTAMIIHD